MVVFVLFVAVLGPITLPVTQRSALGKESVTFIVLETMKTIVEKIPYAGCSTYPPTSRRFA